MGRKSREKAGRRTALLPSQNPPERQTGWQGLLFAAVFVLMGLGFCFYKAPPLQTWLWKRVPCSVQTFALGWQQSGSLGMQPRIETRFVFGWKGGLVTGTNASLDLPSALNFEEAHQLRNSHAAGLLSSCLVNPSNPAEAVLVHVPFRNAGQSIFGLWFPFMGAGIFLVAGENPTRPNRRMLPILVGFMGLFVFFVWTLCSGVAGTVMSWNWIKTEAVVEHSGARWTAGKRPSLRPDIVYRYLVAGRPYLNNQDSFPTAGAATEEGLSTLIASNPVGQTIVCWVNPNDPTQSVIDRGPGWSWIIAVIPLVLLAALVHIIRGILKRPGHD
jgi:hypothetical protein